MTYLPGGSLVFPTWNWNGMLASMSPMICAFALVGYIVSAKTQAAKNDRNWNLLVLGWIACVLSTDSVSIVVSPRCDFSSFVSSPKALIPRATHWEIGNVAAKHLEGVSDGKQRPTTSDGTI